MATYDLGDGVPLEHEVYANGVLSNATVSLALTRPDGTTFSPAPTVSNPSVGIYQATPVPDQVGAWAGAWTTSGTVVSVRPITFVVADPAPQPYASLADVKSYMGIEPDDTTDDDEIASALASVTQEIDDVCGRTFGRTLTASTRTFEPVGPTLVLFDDFHSLTGLTISVDGTTWTAPDYYTLKPINGLAYGRPWPYNRLEARYGYTMPLGWQSVAITTPHWGWQSVPPPVHEACKMGTSETFGAKDARFGVAGWGQYGDIRVRSNPLIMAKLKPYIRQPVKVA